MECGFTVLMLKPNNSHSERILLPSPQESSAFFSPLVHLEFAPKYQLRFLSGSFETLV
jgi:hypothetical protein